MVTISKMDVEEFFKVQKRYNPETSENGWMPVEELRGLIGKKKSISTRKGVYTWWFKESCVEKFLKPLTDKGLLTDKIIVRTFPGLKEKYWLLYVGIASAEDGIDNRFKWHIAQKHKPSNIKKGYLSTLRRTISALLFCEHGCCEKAGILLNSNDDVNEKAETELNKFMNENCILQWFVFDDEGGKAIEKSQLEALETKVIEHKNDKGEKTGYFPLNIQKNWIYSKSENKNNETLKKYYIIKQELTDRRKKVCKK